jgi:hypothetical protein
VKNVLELEHSVAQLPEGDFAKFRNWFWEYENEKWDARIEKEITENKLEEMAEKAIADFKSGKLKSV